MSGGEMTFSRTTGKEVTYTRRFFGDDWLEGLLQVFTLGIGWLIWFAIVAPRGQTPAKQLLSVYIYDYQTGVIASAGRVWMREIVAKYGLGFVATVAWVLLMGSIEGGQLGFSAYFLVGGVFVFFNDDRRALWDRLAGTVVRYRPGGSQTDSAAEGTGLRTDRSLQELDSLRSRGLIDEGEYQKTRREILARI
jgi:uncharacterized RDD family membrane protein YckC